MSVSWAERSPKELAIELTNSCNYYCPFCYKNASIKGQFISDETIAQIDKLIHKKVNNILLTGGEPTLHPRYLNYINLFANYAKVHMISNGSELFDHDPTVLKKLDMIQFSIYGCSNEEYKKMTGANDGYTRLCKSIELTQKNAIPLKAAITLCDSTSDHIELLIETVFRFGIKSLRIGVADVFGRGKYLYGGSNDFTKRKDELYNLLIELKRKYRHKINFELPNINAKHITNHDDIYDYICRNSLQCGCGSEYLVISQAGEIRPCQMLPESWFSLKNKDAFIEHINGNFHIEALRNSVHKFYEDNNFSTSHISPCEALEQFINLEEMDHAP